MSPLYTLANTLDFAITIVIFLIIVRAVLSFLPVGNQRNGFVEALDRVVDPILAPFQRILPSAGGIDFSPMVAILALQALGWLIRMLLTGMH
jgi:YggT family protein